MGSNCCRRLSQSINRLDHTSRYTFVAFLRRKFHLLCRNFLTGWRKQPQGKVCPLRSWRRSVSALVLTASWAVFGQRPMLRSLQLRRRTACRRFLRSLGWVLTTTPQINSSEKHRVNRWGCPLLWLWLQNTKKSRVLPFLPRQVHHKVSKLESKLNYIQIILVIILIVLCAISSIGYSLIHARGLREAGSYVPGPSMNLASECTSANTQQP